MWLGASAADRLRRTPRNLFGQLDGTGNPASGTPTFDSTVWLPADAEPAWLRGGTYVVARKIRMDLEAWDRLAVPEQERRVGRRKDSGAPLSGGQERTAPDFSSRDADGELVIDPRSHARLANPSFNGGAGMFRRSYNYDDGVDPSTGRTDSGLFFIAYVADVERQFVPVQRRLAEQDLLADFTLHVSSSVFAVLPGFGDGSYLGQRLLEGG